MNEILNSYRGDEGRLGRARRLVYGEGQQAGGESVEKLVREVELEASDAWARVQTLLPRTEPTVQEELERYPFYVQVFRTKDVLGSLKERTKLLRLKDMLEAGDDFFNRWYIGLEAALAELRDEIERRGESGS
jgi:radical SAM superfamily enzyme YgiQ (UPF0313 family)